MKFYDKRGILIGKVSFYKEPTFSEFCEYFKNFDMDFNEEYKRLTGKNGSNTDTVIEHKKDEPIEGRRGGSSKK